MISGRKVLLRAILESDLKSIQLIRSDLNLRNQVMMHPFPITSLNDMNWMEGVLNDSNRNSVYFGIEAVQEGDFKGIVSLTNMSLIHRRADFGIYLGEKSRGMGVGSEATSLLLDYAKESLGLKKVELKVLSSNKTAIHVYKRLGFEETVVLKEHFYCEGQFQDVIHMTKFFN